LKKSISVADLYSDSNISTPAFPQIDRRWTLFLDRDGVINLKKEADYVRHPDEFIFLPAVKDALAVLSGLFSRIIVLTNQQGIGKRLMTEQKLEMIHHYMRREVREAGGRIDGVYHCPHLESDGCDCRKPKAGLFQQALRDFPGIDPRCCVMVGDAPSDIALARSQSWISVGVTEKPESLPGAQFYIKQLADLYGLITHQPNNMLL
jgi:histidinol-phosphate phosphatase family protein